MRQHRSHPRAPPGDTGKPAVLRSSSASTFALPLRQVSRVVAPSRLLSGGLNSSGGVASVLGYSLRLSFSRFCSMLVYTLILDLCIAAVNLLRMIFLSEFQLEFSRFYLLRLSIHVRN